MTTPIKPVLLGAKHSSKLDQEFQKERKIILKRNLAILDCKADAAYSLLRTILHITKQEDFSCVDLADFDSYMCLKSADELKVVVDDLAQICLDLHTALTSAEALENIKIFDPKLHDELQQLERFLNDDYEPQHDPQNCAQDSKLKLKPSKTKVPQDSKQDPSSQKPQQ